MRTERTLRRSVNPPPMYWSVQRSVRVLRTALRRTVRRPRFEFVVSNPFDPTTEEVPVFQITQGRAVFVRTAREGFLGPVDTSDQFPSLAEIALKLRRIRTSMGKTQREFAEYAGVKIGVIWNLEIAAVPHVKLGSLLRLASILGVNVASLNPKARELKIRREKRDNQGRWELPVSTEEVIETDSYPRPRIRRDCLTEEEALRLDPEDRYVGDGMNCERPCPFVTCKYHLYVDVNKATKGMKVNFPVITPDEMASMPFRSLMILREDNPLEYQRMMDEEPSRLLPSCALDVADYGDITLDEIADFVGVTRERIRQVSDGAYTKLKNSISGFTMTDYLEVGEGRYSDEMDDHTPVCSPESLGPVLWDGGFDYSLQGIGGGSSGGGE